MSKATEIKSRLDVLKAERAILTIELRNAVTRAAHDLLPEAIRQARPGRKRGKAKARPASPALLRLIARLASRPLKLDRPRDPHTGHHHRLRYTPPMLMVIFGAGASYDSYPDFPPPDVPQGQGNQSIPPIQSSPQNQRELWRPPLANQLFSNPQHAYSHIVKRYPKLTHILHYLSQPSDGRSVEQILELLQDQGKDYPERPREIASVRYYLRDLLYEVSNRWSDETDGATNYPLLIGELLRLNKGNEPIALVTFNYDLLLDRALQTFGYHTQAPDAPLGGHPTLQLFKPHGSVDWARVVKLASPAALKPHQLIEDANILEFTSEFIRVDPPAQADGEAFSQTLFPAIAIPVQNKTDDTFACPRPHLNALLTLLPHVKKVLIIGWQAREAHFLKLLRATKPTHVMVVGRNDADSDNILRYFTTEIGHDPERCFLGQGGFTRLVSQGEARQFLEA